MEALRTQSHAIAFVYNMVRSFHEVIIAENRNNDESEQTISEKKYQKEVRKREEKALNKGRTIHPLFLLVARMARIPSAFIRCFRKCFMTDIAVKDTWRRLERTLYYAL